MLQVTRRGKLIIALPLIYLWVMTGWALYLEGGRKSEPKIRQSHTQEVKKQVNNPAPAVTGRSKKDISSRGNSRRYPSRGSSLRYAGNFIITGYCPCEHCTGKKPGEPGYRQTAASTPARPVFAQEGRTVAADWNILPPGTEIRIEGVPGTFTVEDKGGAVNGLKLDKYFNQHSDALAWGKQTRKVWIVRRATND